MAFDASGEPMVHLRYAVVIEHGATSVGAYLPDLPGCVAVAKTEAEVMTLIREAVQFHLDGMRQHGELIPRPTSTVAYVEASSPT